MADASKAHKLKLANSRKKFKELQELKKKKNDIIKSSENAENGVLEQTPADSLTSSTHSSINNESNTECSSIPMTQLPNYFNDDNFGDNSMFFDTIAQKSSETKVFKPPSIENKEDQLQCEIKEHLEDNYSLFNYENRHSYYKETQHILRPNMDSFTVDDPEIKQNEIFEHHRKKSQNLEQNKQDVLDIQVETRHVSDIESTAIKDEIFKNSSKAKEGVQHSNFNSVSYFSNQMAQSHQPFSKSDSITDLEKRNIELISNIEQEKVLSNQQKLRITELESKVLQLEKENNLKDNNLSEISKLKEELQCHGQTIRLLVTEKSELSASLVQFESNFKQKTSECDELQARLKNSRSRAFELEQELNNLKSEKIRKESNGHDQNELLENLRRDFDNLCHQKDEMLQDFLEVKEKLRTASEENLQLQKTNSELSNKLSLADVKIQQLSGGGHATEAEVEKLVREKLELEKDVTTLNTMLKSITKERDETTAHYQHYTEELNSQLVNLQEQFQRLQQENENLSVQEQNRIRHIGDLERQLQSVQNDRITFSNNFSDGNLKNEFEGAKELCVQLQMEKNELEENYTKTVNEKEMLLKELSAKNDSLGQLESLIEQLRGNQPDSVKLLATMESDKVAAARAVQQNKELKEQLESMHEVIAKMDNDKVELIEKLTLEVSSNKDLLDKLQKTELQLQRLTDAIEIKDRELSLLRDSSEELNKQVLQQEQLADRLRHYEANDNSSHVLQNELQEAKQTIVRLTNEINVNRNNQNDDENIVLRKQLDELRLKNQELEIKLDVDNNFNNASEPANKIDLGKSELMLEKEEAMKHLEEKVKRTMQEIADLSDEKQRLEHLVLQLQGETETIGEYVALYQHQRMVLKQKAVENDVQLKQLASDREQIKSKLDKLNSLVERILSDKRINPELLSQYTENSSQTYIPEDKNVEAATEILTLLSEIKTSNLVEPKESVHSCPYCSGQLITV